MRMVYSSASEDVFFPARKRLVRRFDTWARRRGEPVDPFVVEALVDHRWADGDGLLGRWRPEDLDEALLDWFPRKVSLRPEDSDAIVPTVRAFVDFLFDQDLADARCAERGVLHAALTSWPATSPPRWATRAGTGWRSSGRCGCCARASTPPTRRRPSGLSPTCRPGG